MRKNTSLLIGFFALVLLLAALFLRQGDGARSRPASATWLSSSFTDPVDISNSLDEDSTQHPRAVIAPDTYLHVTWMEGIEIPSPKRRAPAYVRGQGSSWPEWEYVENPTNADATNPAIALDSQGTAHVVWGHGSGSPYDVYYATKPAGESWSAPTNLTVNVSEHSNLPSIAIDSYDKIWVTWQTELGENDYAIYAASKPAGSEDWSAQIISQQPGWSLEPSIAIDANGVPYVVWRKRLAKYDIFYTSYTGGVWATPSNLSNDPSHSYWVRIAANDQGHIFVVWTNECAGDNCFETLFQRWDGNQWLGVPKKISDPNPYAKTTRPAISANGCTIYAVWTDQRDNFPNGLPEIYFSYSSDCGDTWSADEKVSNTPDNSSFWPEVVAEAGGHAHIFWQDTFFHGQSDILYSIATVDIVTPSPIVPTVPTVPTIPTVPPTPHGSVDIAANQPPFSREYARLLNVTLHFSATSPAGNPLEMRYANQSDFQDHPSWESYGTLIASWDLQDDATTCDYKWVYAQFKDSVTGHTSPIYNDYIFFDNYLTATMALNEDKPYTNRTQIMVNSGDIDLAAGCSGLEAISLWEEGLTHTVWINYYPQLYFFLAPQGTSARTVYARYRDRAGNEGTYVDSILFDLDPPYSGTAPILNYEISPTNKLLIPVTGLEAFDDDSGVANVWLSNRSDGPWMTIPYVAPPHEYTWNLAYGGLPRQSPDQHYVYLHYEDDSGYGYLPGNMSGIFSGKIVVTGISNIYLPLNLSGYARGMAAVPGSPETGKGEVDLILLAEPQQAGPGEDVLLWLAAQREQEQPLEGTLRMVLPEGLRVLRAWSAYGQLQQVGEHEVVSWERTWSGQTPWVLVHARVEKAGTTLQVQGEMIWSGGSKVASPLRVGGR